MLWPRPALIRAKGFRSLPVWQGELVYVDFADRYGGRVPGIDSRPPAAAAWLSRLIPSWIIGFLAALRPGGGCLIVLGRFESMARYRSLARVVQVIFRRRLLS